MNLPRKSHPFRAGRAFSLVEMVAVIAILVTLMTAGISILNGTGNQSRRAGVDMISGMIEQARSAAISSRSDVLLVIAEPGSTPGQDERCRIGLFKVPDKWLEAPADIKDAQLISRWQTLNTGIVLLPGDVKSEIKTGETTTTVTIPNPVDPAHKLTITYGGKKELKASGVYAIAFNSRGGLAYPTGSAPIVIRIAEGGYRNGEAKANKRGADQDKVTENRLKIGRVTARPYQIDG